MTTRTVVATGVWSVALIALTFACSTSEREFGSGGAGGDDGGEAGSAGTKATAGSGGSAGSSGNMGGSAGTAEDNSCKSGEKQSCYESADGVSFGGMPPAGQTTCRTGERKCNPETLLWDPCVGAVSPLDADTCEPGNDANCNGMPNEGCKCTNGETRECGTDVGNCVKGQQTCAAQMWGECVGEVKQAAADTCDEGDDANCSGTPNDGCVCINGKTKECGTDVGPCEFGTLTCKDGAWPEDSECMGGVKPADKDTCEPGNDADCSGTANVGCGCTGTGSMDCGLNEGACKYGTQSCVDGKLSMCMGGVSPTTKDTCTARLPANDTNCNGKYGDGCECVASDGPNPAGCGDSGCGQQLCDGATGKYKACSNANSNNRCNPNDPTERQVCGANGVFVAAACPSTQQCTGSGVCKLKDGESCTTGGQCAAGSCNQFYPDGDGDSYKTSGSTVVSLCGAGKMGFIAAGSNLGNDCDDSKSAVNPSATEICDGIDNNCNDNIDYAEVSNLTLGGSVQNRFSGKFSAVAAVGSTYGVTYQRQPSASYFATLTQANAVGVAEKALGDNRWSFAITSNGSKFGVFYRSTFQTISTAGALDNPVTGVEPAGAVLRSVGAHATGGFWFNVGHNEYFNPFSVSAHYSGTKYTDPQPTIPSTARDADIAASDNVFGVVWRDGDGSDPPIVFSPRNTAGAETKSVATLSQVTGNSNPVIVARKSPAGFVIVWASGSSKVNVKEVALNGDLSCGTVSKTVTNFKPDQMVQTSRGYLVVSGAGKIVQGLEVLPGCKFGGLLPKIGDASVDTHPRIAAGSNGFMVVWDNDPETDSNIYSRNLPANLCE